MKAIGKHGGMTRTICLMVAFGVVWVRGGVAQVPESAARFERQASLGRRLADRVVGDVRALEWVDARTLLYTAGAKADAEVPVMRLDVGSGDATPLVDPASLRRAVVAVKPGAPSPRVRRVAAFGGRIELLVDADGPMAVEIAADGARALPLQDAVALRVRRGSVTLPREGGALVARDDDAHSPASAAGDTGIVFVNRRRDAVEIHWVSGDGRKSYGKVDAGASRFQHTFPGHRWVVTATDGKDLGTVVGESAPAVVVIADTATRPADPARTEPSRTKANVVRVVDHDVVVIGADGTSRRLTDGGTDAVGYATDVHPSPDGRHALVFHRTRGAGRRIPLVDSTPDDQLQPTWRLIDYAKPGDALDVRRPHLVDATTGRVVPLDPTHFPTPWSIDRVHWSKDGSYATFVYNQRGHEVVRLLKIDAATAAVTVVVEEKHGAFIDYVNALRIDHLPETGEALWMSERDGWRHVWLLDLDAGRIKRQVTRGPWVVRSIEKIDPASREIVFFAGGIHPGRDPYFLHLARASFDRDGTVVLTDGDGTHEVAWSPDGEHFIDRWSRTDQPWVTEVRRTSDGRKIAELGRADASALRAAGWVAPEPFVAKGRDGTTDIWGLILRPTDFDPSKKYPVIEEIYAGPHGAHVPKSFAPIHGGQAIAELGFIVVRIDGMGTAHRSRAFHEVAWRNLIDAGFPDRIAWMKAAAAKEPAMDLSWVGIYGGSAGGQNALAAVLTHGDFYKAASADCGCHDNRMDKVWWNELWMGWPVGPWYEANANATHVGKLRGDLLLMVGELDTNVDPASTLQVVDALIRADKNFEFIYFPGGGHGAGGSPYGFRRMSEFFLRSASKSRG